MNKKLLQIVAILFSIGLSGCYDHSTPAPGQVVAPQGKFYVGAIAGKF